MTGRDGSEIDLHGEWREAPILDLVSEAVGATVDVHTDADTLRGYADKHDVELQDQWGAAGDRRWSCSSSSSRTP